MNFSGLSEGGRTFLQNVNTNIFPTCCNNIEHHHLGNTTMFVKNSGTDSPGKIHGGWVDSTNLDFGMVGCESMN